MRWIKPLAVMLLATGVAVASRAPAAGPQRRMAAAVAPADATAIRALISLIYGRYHHNHLDRISDERIFAPSTNQIAEENTRLLQGEAGDVDADIILDAQDFGPITVTSVALTSGAGGMVNALVVFNDPENGVHGKAKRITFQRTAMGWRVFDTILCGKRSYRATMLKENAQLRKEAFGSQGAAAAPPVFPVRPAPANPLAQFAAGTLQFRRRRRRPAAPSGIAVQRRRPS